MTVEKDRTSSPPSLPPELNSLYSLLNPESKKLFNKVFVWLWRYVIDRRIYLRSGAVLYYYWAIDILRKQSDLNTSDLSVLTFIYQVTDKGAKAIHSDRIYNSAVVPHLPLNSKQLIISKLVRLGYLSRSFRDPQHKYQRQPWPPHPVFVSFTSKGVMLIKGIESKLYDLVLHSSLDDITGNNKKG